MRAITITEHGGPEVLEMREHPDPEPADDEVRVRVEAAGFNFAELMARQGLYPDAPETPCVVGYEAAGVVDRVGDDVEDYGSGDRVLLATRFGAHADTVCADRRRVYHMPEEMTFEQGAALPVNFLTAYHMLFRVANLRPGDRLLVHMAAGGVGTAVIQLSQTVDGVTVFGTASSGKHDRIREFGCDHPIDYRNNDYEEEVERLTDGDGVDVVLDPLGGGDWKKGYRLLRPVGRLVAFGFANMSSGSERSLFNVAKQYLSMPWFDPVSLMNDNRSIAGVNMLNLWDEIELLSDEMEHLLQLFNYGAIEPQIDSSYAFSEAARAHERMESRENVGKILLVPDRP
ncbi:MAG: medium chain dehydrogenase/reductase family protein [Bradymonadaceae bacterium]